MESLAPPLAVLIHVRWEMERGHSLREAVRNHLQTHPTDGFTLVLRDWVVRKSHGQATKDLVHSLKSPYRRAVLDVFERGWDGEPIIEAIEDLDQEIQSAALAELDLFIASLPFRAMLPLLCLQFPAYLLLLLGPIFTELIHSMGAS